MPSPSDWIDKHPNAVVVFCVSCLLVQVGVGIYLYFWQHPRFPSLRSVQRLFHESSASGNSLKNTWTRLAGASRCLMVTITPTEIWIRPFFPFNIFPTYSDLFHRISRMEVIAAEKFTSHFRSGVMLSFHNARGRLCRLQLRLRNPDDFLASLNSPMDQVDGASPFHG